MEKSDLGSKQTRVQGTQLSVSIFWPKKQVEVQEDLYVCLIDYAKAFNRLKHAEMVDALVKTGIDERIQKISQNSTGIKRL